VSEYFQTIALALIQGLTEFLPISSSAHLILPSAILGWQDQGLAFDTAVHFGTLLAVVWYFRLDLVNLITAFVNQFIGHKSDESRFANYLLIASLPIIPAGFLLKPLIEGDLRSTEVIMIATIVFALVLWVSDWLGKKQTEAKDLKWQDALIIGLAQCLALIPGTSRSGITISLALLLGYSREAAARISFLLSIPAIAGASSLKTYDLVTSETNVDWTVLILGSTVAFLSAYLCIKLFLRFITEMGYTPFVLYRLVLGAILFWLIY